MKPNLSETEKSSEAKKHLAAAIAGTYRLRRKEEIRASLDMDGGVSRRK